MDDWHYTAKEAQTLALEQARATGKKMYIYQSTIGYIVSDRAVLWANYIGAVFPGGRMTWKLAEMPPLPDDIG